MLDYSPSGTSECVKKKAPKPRIFAEGIGGKKHELAVFGDQFRAVSPKLLRVVEVEKKGFIDLLELSGR